MPAGPRLLSYKGRIAGLFFSSAARRQKRRKGSGGLSTASLSTSTMKSDARHERMLCSCKLRLRRASPTVGLPSGDRALLGLRRLHAGGAKTGSYKGHVAGLFSSSAAGRQKRRTGWGRLHERYALPELRQVTRPFQIRTDRNFGACDCYASLSCVT